MTEKKPLTPQQENNTLAAELALGLLTGDEKKAAIDRLAQDVDFAESVHEWQERLAGMAEGMTPVMPPARAWHGIREKLGHVQAVLLEDPIETLRPWWRKPLGALTGFAAIAVAVFLWMQVTPKPPGDGQDYQAQLVSDNPALSVVAHLQGREIKVTLEKGAVPDGRDFEIWWIDPDGADPTSLGLVPASGSAIVTLPKDLVPQKGVKIALSDEPEGGAPTGKVTGTVVAVSDLISF